VSSVYASQFSHVDRFILHVLLKDCVSICVNYIWTFLCTFINNSTEVSCYHCILSRLYILLYLKFWMNINQVIFVFWVMTPFSLVGA
jgi:hypothetical protein